MFIFQKEYIHVIDIKQFCRALLATGIKRDSVKLMEDGEQILQEICESEEMQALWKDYQKKFAYAEDVTWDSVMQAITFLFSQYRK